MNRTEQKERLTDILVSMEEARKELNEKKPSILESIDQSG
ncbi:hypothetical protein SAMN05444416_10164 [Thermoactinomyces sp. DSM 45892]|nr:hypothetical protein SAMN05444416_10164 [Thermoactinomyces sp. DSM 45892]